MSVGTSSIRKTNKKSQQSTYYKQRNGARQLPPLQEGARVLIWDIDHRDWRVPAIVTKVVNKRSFLVQSDRGAVVRRNRHQLKLRSRRSDGNSWEIEQDEDVLEQVEQDKKVQEQVEQDEPEAEEVLAQAQRETTTIERTTSGRKIQLPAWRKDYDT